MPIVKITGQGLSAIALSVALLWACWIQERRMAFRNSSDQSRVLRDLRRLREVRQQPVSVPGRNRSPRVTAG